MTSIDSVEEERVVKKQMQVELASFLYDEEVLWQQKSRSVPLANGRMRI